jgi:hypothetical protein
MTMTANSHHHRARMRSVRVAKRTALFDFTLLSYKIMKHRLNLNNMFINFACFYAEWTCCCDVIDIIITILLLLSFLFLYSSSLFSYNSYRLISDCEKLPCFTLIHTFQQHIVQL